MSKFSATAEELIKDFSLEELLEMNDLLAEDVIEMLLEEGLRATIPYFAEKLKG